MEKTWNKQGVMVFFSIKGVGTVDKLSWVSGLWSKRHLRTSAGHSLLCTEWLLGVSAEYL